jgi:hypothetical protein
MALKGDAIEAPYRALINKTKWRRERNSSGFTFVCNYQSAHSITAGKFDKCLYFSSIFIARKLTIGVINRFVQLNITEKMVQLSLYPLSPRLEPRTVFGSVTLVSAIFSPKQFCSLRRSSIVLSFRATDNIFTGTRTQNRFSVLWPSLL